MPSVGDATYTTKLVVEGDAQYASAMNRAAEANKTYETSSERLTSRRAGAGALSSAAPGIGISGAELDPAEQAAGVAAAMARVAAAPRTGRNMRVGTAERNVRDLNRRLQGEWNRVARQMALGQVPYTEDMQERLKGMVGEAGGLASTLPANIGPSGKVVLPRFTNAMDQATQEANDLIGELRDYADANKAGTQLEKRIQQESRKEEVEENRRRSQAKRAERESVVGRGARALPWLMPSPAGYFVSGAMEAAGASPALILGVVSSMAALGMTAAIVDMVMTYNRQNLSVSTVTGGTGLTSSPLSQATAQVIRESGWSFFNPNAVQQAVQSAVTNNLAPDPNNIAGLARAGQAFGQATGVGPQAGMDIVGQVMARGGMNAYEAERRLVQFNSAVAQTGANITDAAQALQAFLPVIGNGASGGFGDVAAYTALASRFGLTAQQALPGAFTQQGMGAIALGSILGFTPDQYTQLAQTQGGRAQIFTHLSAFASQLNQQLGFTGAAAVLGNIPGALPQGADQNQALRFLLAGNQAGFQNMLQQAINQPLGTTAQVNALNNQAAGASRGAAGLMNTLGTFGGMVKTSAAQAAAVEGRRFVAPTSWQNALGDVGNFLNLPFDFPIQTVGALFGNIGQTRDLGNQSNTASTAQVIGILRVEFVDQQGRPVGQATVPVGPGVPQQAQNTVQVPGPQPGGGGATRTLVTTGRG